MKRSILVLISLVMAIYGFSQEQRIVLMEEFTNASCPPCAAQNPAFDALLQANASKVVPIKYHTSWPGVDPMYSNNPTEATARVTYYGVTGVPHALMDGVSVSGPNYLGAPANLTQAKINTAWAIPSPLKITLIHTKSATNDTVFVSAKVKAVSAITGTHVLMIGIEEKSITFLTPPGTNGETEFLNVMVKLLPGSAGTTLPSTMNAGDSVEYSYYWKTSNVYDHMQLCAVAWVQNNTTKAILQAAYSPPIGPAYPSAKAFGITHPGNIVCGNSLAPKIMIQNLGGPALTSLNINYSINGGTVNTYAWTGSLLFLDKSVVTLPAVSFTPLAANNNLTISVSLPNGQPDPITSDDTVTLTFDQSSTVGTPLTLEIRTDQYPTETTWEIRNSAGAIMSSGGPYSTANTVYTQLLNFSSTECYTFTIFDEYGDGICCSYGSGYYRLKDQNNTIFIQGGQFGKEEMTPFMVDISLGMPSVEVTNTLDVYPNPFDNSTQLSLFLGTSQEVSLEVVNEIGQKVYEMPATFTTAGRHTYDINGETWNPGIFILRVKTGNELITRKISLTK